MKLVVSLEMFCGWMVIGSKDEVYVQHEFTPTTAADTNEHLANVAILAYHCDLVPGVLVRSLGQRMHGAHCIDSFHSLDNLFHQSLTAEHYAHLERVLKVGAPNRLVETSTLKNRKVFIDAGNHSSAWKQQQMLDDCANCDERNCHLVALPAWLKSFAPHLHI